MTTPPGEIPPIRFAQARGARLAYQEFGEGPPTVVGIPPLAQNIEMAWEWPDIRHMLERFGSFCRFIHFDKRGTGASDRRSRIPELDERVDDVRAVMDAAGVDRAHFFVQSEGGPMSLLFGATYPARVESLTLFGTGATTVPPDMSADEKAAARERARLTSAEWGTPASRIVDRFAPSLAHDQDYRTWHQRYERHAATPESLKEMFEISLDVDVREVLSEIDAPALVLHRTGDQAIPIEWGRDLAQRLPNARFLELGGDDHFAYAGDTTLWLDEVERFITGSVSTRPPPVARPQVRIVTLGRFAVEVGGEEVPVSAWGSRLARQLCKRLAAARGWPVTREELIDLLWSDEHDMGKLSARLSVQLSTVRRILDGGVIADRESVRLDLDAVSTDLEDLYKATDPGAVVAAYTGPFLPEDLYDDWTAGIREEARAQFVRAARLMAHDALDRGDTVAASGLARRLIESDQYDDEAHRLLVTALVAAGEDRQARRAHEVWRKALADIDVPVPRFEQVTGS